MIVKHNVICKRLLSKQYAPNVIVGELLDGREKAFLVGKACSNGLPNSVLFYLKRILFHLQMLASLHAILAFYLAIKPAKRTFFLVFQMLFG